MLIRCLFFALAALGSVSLTCSSASGQRGEWNWNQFSRCLGGGFSAGYHWRNPGHKVNYYNPYSEHNTVLVTGIVPQGVPCYLSQMRNAAAAEIPARYDSELPVGVVTPAAAGYGAADRSRSAAAPVSPSALSAINPLDFAAEAASVMASGGQSAEGQQDQAAATSRYPVMVSQPFVPAAARASASGAAAHRSPELPGQTPLNVQNSPAHMSGLSARIVGNDPDRLTTTPLSNEAEGAAVTEVASSPQDESDRMEISATIRGQARATDGVESKKTSPGDAVQNRSTLWPGLYSQQPGRTSSIPYPVQHRKLPRIRKSSEPR